MQRRATTERHQPPVRIDVRQPPVGVGEQVEDVVVHQPAPRLAVEDRRASPASCAAWCSTVLIAQSSSARPDSWRNPA
jgi:hypothetical protein